MEGSKLNSWLIQGGIGLLLTGLVYLLGFQIVRSDFPALLFHYGLFFIAYIGICHYTKKQNKIIFFIVLGIFLRFILIFTIPNLSDDLYRFIWDGRLLIQGINPFDHLPSYYIEQNSQIKGLTRALYNQLNSPNYFTIYPPVNQVIFALATWLFPDSIWGSSMVMKSFLFTFEVGSIFLIVQLLKHFQLPAKNVLFYALNPLIILEITGNLHFEGAMVFFLLLAIWLIGVKGKWVLSAIAFALSVASKLLPLMFLPLFIGRLGIYKAKAITARNEPLINSSIFPLWKGLWSEKFQIWKLLNWKRIIFYFSIIGLTLVLLFIPLFNGVFFSNFGDSLNLYFQKFEFNGSLSYFFRWVGFQIKGYNIIGTIGPILAIVALLGILALTLFEKKVNWQTLFERMLFAICFYLFSSATVHPWYVSLPVAFCLFTRFRFPILWSGLIFLTYINYSYGEYWENLWIVGIELSLIHI